MHQAELDRLTRAKTKWYDYEVRMRDLGQRLLELKGRTDAESLKEEDKIRSKLTELKRKQAELEK